MRGSKIEQLGLAHRDGFRQFVDIEAAAESGDLCRYVLLAERNRSPLETLARKRKNVALVGPHQKKYKCFVGAKQVLHLFGGKRLSICECGARAHLLDCRRGRGLTGPLGDFEGDGQVIVALAHVRAQYKCSKRRECKSRDKSDRLAPPSRPNDLNWPRHLAGMLARRLGGLAVDLDRRRDATEVGRVAGLAEIAVAEPARQRSPRQCFAAGEAADRP